MDAGRELSVPKENKIVEKLPGDGNSKMTYAKQQDDKLSTCQSNTSHPVGHMFDVW